MSDVLEIRVYEARRLVHTAEFAGPVELGRQAEGEPGPYDQKSEAGRWRLVVARRDEEAISRKHALLEALAGGKVRVTNLSTKLPIRLADGTELPPGASCEGAAPAPL